VNAPAGCPAYTTVDKTPISLEKPYLFVNAQGEFNVRVPSAHRDTRGITWADGLTRGRHLILKPGVYDISNSIKVKRRNTVVLGMGLATLHAVDGAIPLSTE